MSSEIGSRLDEERHVHEALSREHERLVASEAQSLDALGEELKLKQAVLEELRRFVGTAPGHIEALRAEARALEREAGRWQRLWLRYGEPLSAAFGVVLAVALFQAAAPLGLGWARWCVIGGLGMGVGAAALLRRWRRHAR